MMMSQKNFKDIFFDNVIDFLWRQWSALGVLGSSVAKENWAIDPEALLVFTLDMGRYDPRLFDEVMDWLVTNGQWIDMQRLRGILNKRNDNTRRLMGAVSEFLSSKGQERKWKNLATLCYKDIPTEREPLFKLQGVEKHIAAVIGVDTDNSFSKYGFFRAFLETSRKSREVSPTADSTIRFMLRALFGVGSRAECVLYLLTHDGGHPSELASAIGISTRGAQDALIELAKSGLVLTRSRGKRKIEYWLSQERWWEFLSRGSLDEAKRPVWIDWIALYGALSEVWNALAEIQTTESEYLKSSRLRDAMEIVGNEFARSGMDIPSIPGPNVKPENYEKAFIAFIGRVFGIDENVSASNGGLESASKIKVRKLLW
jgi:hypothetical protein